MPTKKKFGSRFNPSNTMEAWGYQLQDDLKVLLQLGVIDDKKGWIAQGTVLMKHLMMARMAVRKQIKKSEN